MGAGTDKAPQKGETTALEGKSLSIAKSTISELMEMVDRAVEGKSLSIASELVEMVERTVKARLDPNGVMNPGKLLPDERP